MLIISQLTDQLETLQQMARRFHCQIENLTQFDNKYRFYVAILIADNALPNNAAFEESAILEGKIIKQVIL